MFILTSQNITHFKLSELSELCASVEIFIQIGGLSRSIHTCTSSGCGLYARNPRNWSSERKDLLWQRRAHTYYDRGKHILTMTEASTYWLPIVSGALNFLVKPMTSASIYRTPRPMFLCFRAARSEWGSNQPSPFKPEQGNKQMIDLLGPISGINLPIMLNG